MPFAADIALEGMGSEEKRMNVLALYAHPADAEMACGGTLLKYRQAGHTIFLALAAGCSARQMGDAATREEANECWEAAAKRAASALQAEVLFLRLGDLYDTPESRRAVLTALRWANPDVIFTHHPKDFVPDHSMTSRLVTEVLLSVGGKLHPADLPPIDKQPCVFFTGAWADIRTQPKAVVDVAAQYERKQELLRHYQDSYQKTCAMGSDVWEEVQVIDHMRGIWTGLEYAEGFTGHKILGYCADYRLLP